MIKSIKKNSIIHQIFIIPHFRCCMSYNDFNFLRMSSLFEFNPKYARIILFYFFFNKAKKIQFTSKHDDVF